MKQRVYKALSLILAVITLLSVLLLPATAAVAPIINPMLDTYVVEDLKTMSYNPANYPLDPSSEHLQLIHFLEYAYSPDDSRYYGLYLYLYNPSGKEISLNGNYVQMSFGSGSTDYLKYPLEVMSYSIDTGDKFVFYKFRVNGVKSSMKQLNPVSRVYNIANLEILYEGETKVTTKSWEQNDQDTRKNVWKYQGYQKGFGSETDTLMYFVDELDTIPVEMHDASWLSDTSNLGTDYRWEVKSYYFNIPYSYIMKYGDPIDIQNTGTHGLYAVNGEYYKYGLNGLVVPDEATYDKFKSSVDRFMLVDGMTIPSWAGFSFNLNSSNAVDYVYSKNPSGNVYTKYTSDFVFNIFEGEKFLTSSLLDYTSDAGFTLNKYCLLSQGSSVHISNEELEALWIAAGKPVLGNKSYLYMGDKTTDIGTRQDFSVSIDGKDLSSAIKTYASTKEDGFGKWLHKLFNKELYTDELGYFDCKPLIEVSDLKEYTKAEYVGSDLYLDYESYQELCDFVKKKRLYLSDGIVANNVYLMRLAVEPYYETEVDLHESPTSFESFSTGYYYEKVIHKDVDIFSFTFQNAKGAKQTIPVDCDPVDNVGAVVPGDNRVDSNPNGYPDEPTIPDLIGDGIEDALKWLDSLKAMVLLVGVSIISIAVLTLVIVFWKYLEPWFMRAGKLLGKVFGFLGKAAVFIVKLLLYPLIFLWNIGIMIASIWFPPASILRIPMKLDFGGGKDDSKYYYEDRKYKQSEERRKQERHEAEMRELERRSKGGSKSERNHSKDDKSYDSDEFFEAALKRAEDEFKKE